MIIRCWIQMIPLKQLLHKLPEYLSKGQESAFYADNLNGGKWQKTKWCHQIIFYSYQSVLCCPICKTTLCCKKLDKTGLRAWTSTCSVMVFSVLVRKVQGGTENPEPWHQPRTLFYVCCPPGHCTPDTLQAGFNNSFIAIVKERMSALLSFADR